MKKDTSKTPRSAAKEGTVVEAPETTQPEPVAVPEAPAPEMHNPMHTEEEPQSSVAPILGAILVVLVIVLGGFYLWGAMLSEEEVTHEEMMEEMPPEKPENTEPPVSNSDEIEALEEDMDNTDFEELDRDMAEMEAELDAALEAQ